MAAICQRTEISRHLLPRSSGVEKAVIELAVSSLHTEPGFSWNHLCPVKVALYPSLKGKTTVHESDLSEAPFLFLFVIQGLAL